MADDIVIEEHSILEHPKIQKIFVDVSIIKQEIEHYEQDIEKQVSCLNYTILEQEPSPDTILDSEENETLGVGSFTKAEISSFQIMPLGQTTLNNTKKVQPKLTTDCLDFEKFEILTSVTKAKVLLHNLKSYLKSHENYCTVCLTLFPDKDFYDNHVTNFHMRTTAANIPQFIIEKNVLQGQYMEIDKVMQMSDKVKGKRSRNLMYKCYICSLYLTRPQGYLSHMRNRHYITKIPTLKRVKFEPWCRFCSKYLNNLEHYRAHIYDEHGNIANKKLDLIVDNLSNTKSGNAINTHNKNIDYYYKCYICGLYFKTLRGYKVHMYLRYKIARLPVLQKVKYDPICMFCKKDSRSFNVYQVHMAVTHKGEIYEKLQSLQTRIHGPLQDFQQIGKECFNSEFYKCYICGLYLMTGQEYKSHINQMHAVTVLPELKSTYFDTECSFCKKEFACLYSYQNHIVDEHGDKLNKKVNNLENIQSNDSAHAENARNDDISQSENTYKLHHDMKFFKCHVCGMYLLTTRGYERHMNSMHNITELPVMGKVHFNPVCDFCETRCSSTREYQKHVIDRHRNIMYKKVNRLTVVKKNSQSRFSSFHFYSKIPKRHDSGVKGKRKLIKPVLISKKNSNLESEQTNDRIHDSQDEISQNCDNLQAGNPQKGVIYTKNYEVSQNNYILHREDNERRQHLEKTNFNEVINNKDESPESDQADDERHEVEFSISNERKPAESEQENDDGDEAEFSISDECKLAESEQEHDDRHEAEFSISDECKGAESEQENDDRDEAEFSISDECKVAESEQEHDDRHEVDFSISDECKPVECEQEDDDGHDVDFSISDECKPVECEQEDDDGHDVEFSISDGHNLQSNNAEKNNMGVVHTEVPSSEQQNISTNKKVEKLQESNILQAENSESHHRPKFFRCLVCGLYFASLKAYMMHVKGKHFFNPVCHLCCERCDNFHSYRAHLSIKHKDVINTNNWALVNDEISRNDVIVRPKDASKLYRCQVCGQRYSALKGYMIHIKRRHFLNPICHLCSKRCDSYYSYGSHLSEQHKDVDGVKEWALKHDKYLRKYMGLTDNHGSHRYEDTKFFRCHVCGIYYKYWKTYINHIQRKHNLIEPSTTKKVNYNPFCHLCNVRCDTFYSYSAHMTMKHKAIVNNKKWAADKNESKGSERKQKCDLINEDKKEDIEQRQYKKKIKIDGVVHKSRGQPDQGNANIDTKFQEKKLKFYRCDSCWYYFNESAALQNHLENYHGLSIPSSSMKPVKFDSKCKFCSESEHTIESYNAHLMLAHRNLFNDNTGPSASHSCTENESADLIKKIERSEIKCNRPNKSDELDKNKLVKAIIFKCIKCDIHFLSATTAENHVDHMEMLINWKCNICKRIFKREDGVLHKKQHNFSHEFNVFEVNPTLQSRVLFKCPKCVVHFTEEKYLKHTNCEKCLPNAVYCRTCDFLIVDSIQESHESSHVNEHSKVNDFLIIEAHSIKENEVEDDE